MGNTIEGVNQNIERTMSGLKDGVATATQGLEQAQSTVRDGMQSTMKHAEAMLSFGQGNVQAVAQSSQILAEGLQSFGQTVVAGMQASFNDAVGAFKAMAAAKSIREAMELQSGLMRATMERAASQTSQMTEGAIKLSEKSFAPIGARLSAAAEQFGRAS